MRQLIRVDSSMCIFLDQPFVVGIGHKTQMALELARQMLLSICVLALYTSCGYYWGQHLELWIAWLRIATIQGQSLMKKMLHTSSLVLTKSVHKR